MMDLVRWLTGWTAWYFKTMLKACLLVGFGLILFTIITGM